MISERFSKSFYSFIERHKFFSESEKNEVVKIFKSKTIQIIFSVSLYLIIWSFVVAFIDTALVTRGVVFTFKSFGIFNSFLPSFIFLFINATVKFIFIYIYTKKRIEVSLKHVFIGVIPLIGSLFFTAYLLRNRPLIAKALKQYFKYIKKDFKYIKILKNN